MARVVVGMLGLGTVGTGVVRLLAKQKQMVLKKIAVRDLAKAREIEPPCPVTTNAGEVIDDPEIEIVVEVMGGEQPALDFLKRAIEKRKHIVTANKEVLAKHGPTLFSQARQKSIAIFFEASVAGGVPLISTIHKGLEANEISSVCGILNGTTNFILSQMEQQGQSFADALKQAQAMGFAESDPTNDVDGFDVAYKLSILSALAFGRFAKPQEIFREGIGNLSQEDILQAKQLGYRLKLIGSAVQAGEQLAVRVHPALVPLEHPLANVAGSHNGIVVAGHAAGKITMLGPGAGQMPTASAVVGDMINLASALQLPDFASYFQASIAPKWAPLSDPGEWVCPFFINLLVQDSPGVIGKIGTIFGEHSISIRSIMQNPQQATEEAAQVLILTHAVKSKNMEHALVQLSKQSFLKNIKASLRIMADDTKE